MKSSDQAVLKVLGEILAALDPRVCPGPDEVDRIEKLVRKAIHLIERRRDGSIRKEVR